MKKIIFTFICLLTIGPETKADINTDLKNTFVDRNSLDIPLPNNVEEKRFQQEENRLRKIGLKKSFLSIEEGSSLNEKDVSGRLSGYDPIRKHYDTMNKQKSDATKIVRPSGLQNKK